MFDRYGVKDIATTTFYKIGTKTPVIVFESLKASTIENAAEAVYATGGRGNPRLLGWDLNRTSTVNLEDALISEKSLAMLAGMEDVEVGAQTVYWREELIAVDDGGAVVVTLSKTPINGSVKTYKNGEYNTVIAGTVVDKEVTYAAGVTAGDIVEVFYDFTTPATAKTVTFSSDKFPDYYTVVMDGLWRNTRTGKDEPVQYIMPKVKLQPGHTITMEAEGEPSTFPFSLEVFKADANTQMIKLVKWTDD